MDDPAAAVSAGYSSEDRDVERNGLTALLWLIGTLAVLVLILGVHVFAPRIAAAIPALAPFLSTYVDVVGGPHSHGSRKRLQPSLTGFGIRSSPTRVEGAALLLKPGSISARMAIAAASAVGRSARWVRSRSRRTNQAPAFKPSVSWNRGGGNGLSRGSRRRGNLGLACHIRWRLAKTPCYTGRTARSDCASSTTRSRASLAPCRCSCRGTTGVAPTAVGWSRMALVS